VAIVTLADAFLICLFIAIAGGGISMAAVVLVALGGGISRRKIAKAAIISVAYLCGTLLMIIGYHHLENRLNSCFQLAGIILTLPWSALVVIGYLEEIWIHNPLPLEICATLNAIAIFLLLCRKPRVNVPDSGWRGCQ
jgi:hypothetical protein